MNKIVYYPEKILRSKTKKIEKVDQKLLLEIEELKRLLRESFGVGLAAPQIGLDRRFLAIREDREKEMVVYINPEIKAVFGEKIFPKMIDAKGKEDDFLEGCLSFPNYWGTVKRFLKIEAVWQEPVGGKLMERKKIMTGLEAVIFQHEYDHLDGVLFVDRVKEDGGKFFKSEGEKMVKWNVDKVIGGKL